MYTLRIFLAVQIEMKYQEKSGKICVLSRVVIQIIIATNNLKHQTIRFKNIFIYTKQKLWSINNTSYDVMLVIITLVLWVFMKLSFWQ